jgi:molybdopterin-containing oxidoreductase family iron-sulfur binding subunit
VTSPSLLDQIEKFRAKTGAKWFTHEPVSRANVYEGARAAYNRPLEPIYDFSSADIVVALDADVLAAEETPGNLRYARDFASRRHVVGTKGEMSRVYAFEPTPSLTGLMADHRYPVKFSNVAAVALELAQRLGIAVASAPASGVAPKDLDAIVEDLKAAGPGRTIIVAGPRQSPEVHALVHAMNARLQNVGNTVKFAEPVDFGVTKANGDLKDLTTAMAQGSVEFLVIVGGNPVFDAPADLKFGDALAKVKHSVYLARETNETGENVEWELPLTHPLEEWGDARAFDGTVSLAQPLIAPLFEGRTAAQILSGMMGKPIASYDLVKGYWQKTGLPGASFESAWRDFVHDGVLKNSALPVINLSGATPTVPGDLAAVAAQKELIIKADPTIYDGRYANNGWLQELPKPITKLTWDNCVQLSINTAKQLGVNNDDIVTLEANGSTVEGIVFVQPGQADDTVVVTLGYGRTRGGTVATVSGDNGGGFNVYPFRSSSNLWLVPNPEIKLKASGAGVLASTQGHNPLGGDSIDDERDIVRETRLDLFNEDNSEVVPWFAMPEEEIKENNLYVEEVFEWNGNKWGMTIDLNTCIGCNACVTACQSENNIPVVGKIQVKRNREMHWIRIDRYYSGEAENPNVTWQPVACVQCERAPCEPVCPVAATVHSHEGLNQMVYNRCVGTRYCSNNCPYKVRRFNYLNYSDNQPNFSNVVWEKKEIPGVIHTPKTDGIALLKMVNNPNVTVRGRGIMEKCTYCVQRINDARKEAKKGGKDIKDGDIVTACQQACPTQAIVFGDLADKNSRVSKLHNDPRAWLLLAELGVKPRTAHLAKLRNPNPTISPITEEMRQSPRRKKHEGHSTEHGSEMKSEESHATPEGSEVTGG